jgi:hypothetical protein
MNRVRDMAADEQCLPTAGAGFVMRLFCLILAFIVTATPAAAADWVVARITGQAWLTTPGTPPRAVTQGMALPQGQTLSTGANARARLERNGASIVIGPSTVVTPRDSWWGSTTIVQHVGRTELEVGKRNLQNFSVETPFLSADVKGARVTVDVSRQAASVHVSHGLVQVSHRASGRVADILAGQRAAVATGSSGLQVSGTGQAPGQHQGPSHRPDATPATPAAQGEPGKSSGRSGSGETSPGKADGGKDSGGKDPGEKGQDAAGSDDKGSGGKGSDGPGSQGNGGQGKADKD